MARGAWLRSMWPAGLILAAFKEDDSFDADPFGLIETEESGARRPDREAYDPGYLQSLQNMQDAQTAR